MEFLAFRCMFISNEDNIKHYNSNNAFECLITYYETFKKFNDEIPILHKVIDLTICVQSNFILDGDTFPNVRHLNLCGHKYLIIIKSPFQNLDFVSINVSQVRNVFELGPIKDLMLHIQECDIDVEYYMEYIMNSLRGFRGRLLLKMPRGYEQFIKAVPTHTFIVDNSGRYLPVDFPLMIRAKSAM